MDKWGFRGSFPATQDLLSSIGDKQYDYWGNVIEAARLSDASDYLTLSGWESTAIENHSGLVDNLRNFHGDPAFIRDRLAPLLPVAKPRHTVLAAGEGTSLAGSRPSLIARRALMTSSLLAAACRAAPTRWRTPSKKLLTPSSIRRSDLGRPAACPSP